ncbi:MAG: Nramp family divalent metal transporter [Actinomycetaceae bacterium]|nr:Nramp family divalent metal transporter [Arcanobacterium sp.]MDD7686544.1 Nramp family divalent metal transporter [Actinomycetaceae bacterium]MDY5272824.1 Nramp family divalent metal transporter [Arcanobacterium sp.]
MSTSGDLSPHAPSPNTPKKLISLIGPAFVAAVAFVDPGNVAANISAGAQYGYLLVWVLVLANVMAVLVQYQSAKLGIVTGASLPQLLGARLPRVPRLLYWAQAEIVAAATDLAEVVGGAIALNLLFDLPLIWGGIVIGLVSLLLLALQNEGKQRLFEILVIGLLLIITFGFISGLFIDPPHAGALVNGLVPKFADAQSVLLATSMLGATVMPHAIYLHSSLVNDRFSGKNVPLKRLLRASKIDVTWALLLAGAVNVCLLLVAATSLAGVPGTDTIDGAYHAIRGALGPVVATFFAVGLLASGLASTSVGAYAGSEIMKGLLHREYSLVTRRAITLAPALIVLALGVEPSWALVISQVVLSLGIPFALIPLMLCTRSRAIMGDFADSFGIQVLFSIVAALVIALNVALLIISGLGM